MADKDSIKIGKNFASQPFSKNGQLYPAEELLVKNLNKMMDNTGTFTWLITSSQKITYSGKQLGKPFAESDSFEGNIDRKGSGVLFSGTLKTEFYSGKDKNVTVVKIKDIISNKYSPIGNNASYFSNNPNDPYAVIISNNDGYFFMPSKKGVVRTLSFAMRWIGGPVLVSSDNKLEHLKMTDNISTNIMNAVFSAFSKSSDKMPRRPGASDASYKRVSMGESSSIVRGFIITAKSAMSTNLSGSVDMKQNSGSSGVYKFTADQSKGYTPPQQTDVSVNLLRIYKNDKGEQKTNEWITSGTIDSNAVITINLPDTYVKLNKEPNSTFVVNMTSTW